MKTATVLQFSDLLDLARYIKCIHVTAYRIDTSKLTLKAALTPFEIAIAAEQHKATVIGQMETV